MDFLVTAGNTLVEIDRVRCLTNIFSGRTGARIALAAHQRSHTVTLLTSHPDVIAELRPGLPPPAERWTVRRYRTFDDLAALMQRELSRGGADALIHSAAVSDYRSTGVFAPAPGTKFEDGRWLGETPELVDRAAGKVKSDEPELWLRLVRTPKLVDKVRGEWGFRGLLVKFKLEVDKSQDELLAVAERSRRQSAADLMVANTLEGYHSWALLGPIGGQYQRVGRDDLAERLLDAVERLHGEGTHG